jgi:hypothetical protein
LSGGYYGRVGARLWLGLAAVVCAAAAQGQIIEFESSGLRYKALTHGGVTIMFASLPLHIRDYAVLQIAVSNGSTISWSIKPEDFRFERADGTAIQALPARTVVDTMREKATHGDVIKLVSAYEAALYGNTQIHSNNGYESRRQNMLAMGGSNKINAAAAASAIALVATKLVPGQSTDGAIFYQNQGRPLGAGRLTVTAAAETFTFPVEAESPHR